ncbi:MAG TPA: EAL domain-containing protein, partial [Thermoanaerobaculia bacterium]|nr:EAL domain-containing protein [Thermoanaerobaculia bacterium]
IGMIACLLEDEREAAEIASAQIEHLAYHDALTGLPNRPLFLDRTIVALANANRAGHKLGVLFLDLDRFKDINDSLGHTVGDALLKSVAERIRRCVREGDTVARFGGDEFTLLIPKIDYVEDAAKIAQKVIETLKIPFEILDRELFITTSVGVSIYPNDGIDSETLIRNADTAMYRAKDQGRDNYQLYAPAMNVRALERLALENMLRKALHNEELVLHYQPLIDARTRMITGVEALIRWEHPELGLLYPASFISVAELSGLILPIEQWVLRTACRQIRYWQRKIVHDMTISVNLSARQFQQPDLAEQIRVVVEDCGIQPSTLQVEITESNAMQNADNTIHILRDLKSAGIRIAMDDFGTGYSSLNYLKRFPIDTLKLDRMFVNDVATDPIDAAIVSSVIDMAHSLSLKVVAEGVETDAQVDFLTRQQCDVLQGYLFGTPRTAEEMELMLLDARAAV